MSLSLSLSLSFFHSGAGQRPWTTGELLIHGLERRLKGIGPSKDLAQAGDKLLSNSVQLPFPSWTFNDRLGIGKGEGEGRVSCKPAPWTRRDGGGRVSLKPTPPLDAESLSESPPKPFLLFCGGHLLNSFLNSLE